MRCYGRMLPAGYHGGHGGRYNQVYSRNPGVELADITEERAERYRAQQKAVKARLRAAPGQVEDRFNPVTDPAVATRPMAPAAEQGQCDR